MLSNSIREAFLKFFKNNQHVEVPSSPVFPYNDDSILFTNAGMNQFKDFFLKKTIPSFSKAVSSQKCIRAGGKHNDLENVGHTSRHLTFFEMLGNFSFGDYFKKQAIDFAWKVSTEVFKFPLEKIWVSVFENDDESFVYWTEYLPEERIVRLGEKENFWSMANTGPCGPCSELLYDKGKDFGDAPTPKEDSSGERFLEYWNLVFMEFNKIETGDLVPLPSKNIDTGAGLERLLTLIENVPSVFEIDVLRELIKTIERISKKTYDPKDLFLSPAFRVIADHIRSLSFSIADGLRPSNIDRGYVLRKIIRRSVNYGKRLNLPSPFLPEIVPTLVDLMGKHYPELVNSKETIQQTLAIEEENFLKNLKKGDQLLSKVIQKTPKNHAISGEDVFKLKDTYGLPLEEIILFAKDNNFNVNLEEFLSLEKEAKNLSRQAQKKHLNQDSQLLYEEFLKNNSPSYFSGYTTCSKENAKIQAIIKNGCFFSSLHEGEEGTIILDNTPFYAEKGGQIGDQGKIFSQIGEFFVNDTQIPYQGIIAHQGTLIKGSLSLHESTTAQVSQKFREKVSRNHSATHLLHWALREVLGATAKQAGSLVTEKKLRFDFSYPFAIQEKQLEEIENLVNEKVREAISICTYESDYDKISKDKDILQFFGDKYGDKVRVIEINSSKELCGGTHAKNTSSIGYFKIIKESSIASGIRRIEALTGEEAQEYSFFENKIIKSSSSLLLTPLESIVEKIEELKEENKKLEKTIKELNSHLISYEASNIESKVKNIKNFSFLFSALKEKDLAKIRDYAEILRKKLTSGLILLVGSKNDRTILLTCITDDLISQGKSAQKFLSDILLTIKGKSGGSPKLAQGSCEKISEKTLVTLAEEWISHL